MNASTVDTLLAHEELLRALARDLLRDEHAVDDVVQQTWLVALQREPRMSEAFGAWLVSIARNFALRALRTSARRHEREKRSAVVEALPSTQAILEREETRRRVVQAVIRLGEPHRAAIVLFYFDGLPPREIARRLGIPVETVRSRLKRARSELRAQLEREHGQSDRGIHHMLLPLAGASGWSRWAAPAVPPALAGVLLMTAKVKVGIAAACLVLGLGAGVALWSIADREAPARQLSATTDAVPRVPPARAQDPGTDARVETPAAPDRSSLPAGEATTTAPAATGSLLVRAVWEQDGTPAENVVITVAEQAKANPDFHTITVVTDVDGSVRCEDLRQSEYWVDFSQSYLHRKSVRVTAGGEALVVLKIPAGIEIDGIVVDKSGAPVANAAILIGPGAFEPRLERPPVAHSAADGTFKLSSLPDHHEIAAVAEGLAPSLWQWIHESEGKHQRVRLVLEDRAGEVRGEVVDKDGEPVVNALVRITLGKFEGYKPRQGAWVATPKECWARSDEDGLFALKNVPVGTFPIEVRADGYGTWRDRVEVSLQVASEVHVELAQGASVHGTITTADGKPAAKIQVRVGWYPDVMSSSTVTDAAGHFQLGELTPGEIEVVADADEAGKATGTVLARPGQDVEWSGVLSIGLSITGRVLDDQDAPVARCPIHAYPTRAEDREDGRYFRMTISDEQGRFQLINLKDISHYVELTTPGSQRRTDSREDVHPSREEIVFRVPRANLPSVMITGRVLGRDGERLETWSVEALHADLGRCGFAKVDAKAGTFSIEQIPAGTYQLSLRGPELPSFLTPSHPIAAGETWDAGEIRFPTSGSLTLHLQRDPGLPREEPRLSLLSLDGTAPYQQIEAKGDQARWDHLAPGRYAVEVMGIGYARTRTPFQVSTGAETEVQVVLQRGCKKTLRLVLDDEKLPASFTVAEHDADGALLGEYLVRFTARTYDLALWLAPGHYVITASSKSGRHGSAAVDVRAGEAEDAPVEMVIH